MDLTTAVYQLTSTFPREELYGLSSQMRRAAVSVASNIAEGAGRETRKDFRKFVIMARGSSCELQTQLLIAANLGYCRESQVSDIEPLIMDVGRMLNGLSKYLKLKQTSGTEHSTQH